VVQSRGPAARGVVAVLIGVVLVAWSASAGAAAVDSRPRYPTRDQVQRARDAATSTAAQVHAAAAAIATDAARLAATRLAAEQAAEACNAARIRLTRLTDLATAAAANAEQADVAVGQMRAAVGRLAAQDYRVGRPTLLDVLFSSRSPQDLADGTTSLDILAGGRVQAMQRLRVARTVASGEHARASLALQQQQAATVSLAAARSAASQAADQAAAELAQSRAQESRLMSRLATAQRAALALQQARAAGLAQDAAAAARLRAVSYPSAPAGTNDPVPTPAGGADAVVAWARRQVGLPYRWAAAGPDSYDCSGLTMRAWQQAGLDLPHYAASQYAMSRRVRYASLQPGDLIFYATDTSSPATIHHVTMYVGDGLMIEAPYTGANVRIVPIRWNQAMPWAGRP
jgi:cell wall-associated NlpC family hydrolase